MPMTFIVVTVLFASSVYEIPEITIRFSIIEMAYLFSPFRTRTLKDLKHQMVNVVSL